MENCSQTCSFKVSDPKEICQGVVGMVGAGMRRGISCSLKWEELTSCEHGDWEILGVGKE